MGLIDLLVPPGEGQAGLREYLDRKAHQHGVHSALARVARRCQPVSYDELIEVTEVWVETALALDRGRSAADGAPGGGTGAAPGPGRCAARAGPAQCRPLNAAGARADGAASSASRAVRRRANSDLSRRTWLAPCAASSSEPMPRQPRQSWNSAVAPTCAALLRSAWARSRKIAASPAAAAASSSVDQLLGVGDEVVDDSGSGSRPARPVGAAVRAAPIEHRQVVDRRRGRCRAARRRRDLARRPAVGSAGRPARAARRRRPAWSGRRRCRPPRTGGGSRRSRRRSARRTAARPGRRSRSDAA